MVNSLNIMLPQIVYLGRLVTNTVVVVTMDSDWLLAANHILFF